MQVLTLYLIIVFGLLMIAVAMLMWSRPVAFLNGMRRWSGTASLQLLAVVVRLILGFALITYAGQSRFPLVLQIIGVLSVITALVFAAVPRRYFERLIGWLLDRFESRVRAAAVLPFLFGVFLIYAVN